MFYRHYCGSTLNLVIVLVFYLFHHQLPSSGNLTASPSPAEAVGLTEQHSALISAQFLLLKGAHLHFGTH